VPPHQVHDAFVQFQRKSIGDMRKRFIFDRLVEKRTNREALGRAFFLREMARWRRSMGSVFYAAGDFPSTGVRMRHYETEAPALAERAVRNLELGDRKRNEITHLIVTSCTGFFGSWHRLTAL